MTPERERAARAAERATPGAAEVPGERTSVIAVDPAERAALLAGDHAEPHGILGAHPVAGPDGPGVVVRAFHPDAVAAECVLQAHSEAAGPASSAGAGELRRSGPEQQASSSGAGLHEVESPSAAPATAMEPLGGGLFALFLPGAAMPLPYRLRFRFANGTAWEREDPYRFLPTLGEVDLHLFGEGTHRRLWEVLGAHPRQVDGVDGVAFAVWAPNARRVSVVGDFCWWDGRLYPMRRLGSSGVFELFLPGIAPGALYKYELKTRGGMLRLKTDPMASSMELPPGTASRVTTSSYIWGDAGWMASRPGRDPRHEPMAIYEAHLGSWARVPEEGSRPLTYREIAPRLVEHVRRFGFTHIELLPVAEHPFAGSWGYQVTGYYAPTSRYGTPDDFRYLVDLCHQNGVGVILDWVPAHFPKDDFALRRFDGTALYEHEDPRLGEHPDWGTLIFNFGRDEVRNFLIANALYWFEEFHVDGLRVDAVASMLYLDYSRRPGEWIPNPFGGRENLEAVAFLRALNETVREEQPGCFTVAEESTAWPGVTRRASEGGLGFTFKWNMGWMHDTLLYFSKDPIYRRWHHDQLTFAMVYEASERFIMPLSHDEVVHGKGSLLQKLPGDEWQKFANLRLLLTYQFTRPGKKLLFMGTELAPWREWNHDASLDWHLAADPMRAGLQRFLEDLGRMYHDCPALWRTDPEPGAFAWIDCSDRENSVVSYVRRERQEHVVVVLNLTPTPLDGYRIGAPASGTYLRRFSSDERRYGGSELETLSSVVTEPVPLHGHAHSMALRLPPLGALVLVPEP